MYSFFGQMNMKKFLAVLIVTLTTWSSSQAWQIDPAVAAEIGSPCTRDDLPAELVASWGQQEEFFCIENFTILEWTDAQALLLRKSYRGGKQYHTGWFTIYTIDGRKYLTKQPVMDAFFEFMKQNSLSAQGFASE